MFEGCLRRKFQLGYANIPEVAESLDRLCFSNPCCTRTGMPHPNWEHEVDGGKISKFSTRDLSEYPKGYCKVVDKALVRYLQE